MSELICHCLSFAVPDVSLLPLQHFFTSYNCSSAVFHTRAWPSYVLNQNPHVQCGWRTAHWQTIVVGHSMLKIEPCCPGEGCLQWRWMVWWMDEGGGLGVCFSSVLKSSCVSGLGGAKNNSSPLEEQLHKVTSLPWAFMHKAKRPNCFVLFLFSRILSPSLFLSVA